jgi:uncharacterized protein YegP (UPF0339 family)
MPGRIVLKTVSGQFTFELEAGGNMLSGEHYVRKANALFRIESLRVNAANEACYQRKIAPSGHPYFILRAANNDILGTSELYDSRAARDAGIAAMRTHAPHAVLEDHTVEPAVLEPAILEPAILEPAILEKSVLEKSRSA